MGCQICNHKEKNIFFPHDRCSNCGWIIDDFIEFHFSSERLAEFVKNKALFIGQVFIESYLGVRTLKRYKNVWVVCVPIITNTMIIEPGIIQGWSFYNKSTISDYRKLYYRIEKIKAFT